VQRVIGVQLTRGGWLATIDADIPRIWRRILPKRVLALLLLALFCLLAVPAVGLAQGGDADFALPEEEILEATVGYVAAEEYLEVMGQELLYQELELLVTRGSLEGQVIVVATDRVPLVSSRRYAEGHRVQVSRTVGPDGRDRFVIIDYVRRGPLIWLLSAFVVLVLVVARWRGLASILGMVVSFAVIFYYLLPRIAAGDEPVVVALMSAAITVPVTFALSHGISRKTLVAVAGTLGGLAITGVLAVVFVEAARLTGFASDEAGFLFMQAPGEINIKGLFIAGFIVGVVGVLDDVTVAQAGVVQQLRQANRELGVGELYGRAMAVGQDHVASLVNTLVLVYAGASLPLLLLFLDNTQSLARVINYELVAQEIVRTLVASIGVVATVPITTLLAAAVLGRRQARESTQPGS
jgi:uncharacterized membrane protein